MDGPFFFPGFHALFALAFLVFWLVVVAGLLWALYFVVRTAVTKGILRADAERHAGPPPVRPQPAPPVASAPPAARPDGPAADPTPPDIAA